MAEFTVVLDNKAFYTYIGATRLRIIKQYLCIQALHERCFQFLFKNPTQVEDVVAITAFLKKELIAPLENIGVVNNVDIYKVADTVINRFMLDVYPAIVWALSNFALTSAPDTFYVTQVKLNLAGGRVHVTLKTRDDGV